MRGALALSAVLSGTAVLGILVFLLASAAPVLGEEPTLWTWVWRPHEGRFGILPMVVATAATSAAALVLALPLALGVVLFAHGLGPRLLGRWVLGAVHLMTGVPTVVYAFVSAVLLVPMARQAFAHGSGHSLLTAVPVLAALVLPTLVLVLEAAWRPLDAEVGAVCAALGLTRAQALVRVVLPLSRRALVAAALLGFARAVGDTMIPLVVAGNAPQVPASPLDAVRTLTAHVALTYSTDTQGPGHASIYAAGLLLLLVTAVASLGARSLGPGRPGGDRAAAS